MEFDKTLDILKNSLNQLYETENIGINSLNKQKETIIKSQNNKLKINQELNF